MKKQQFSRFLFVLVGFGLVGCNYENSFQGHTVRPDGAPSSTVTLDAYSKNARKYCIQLSWNIPEPLPAQIGASDVMDRDDILKTKAFNTKQSPCNEGDAVYAVGKRETQIKTRSRVRMMQSCGPQICRAIEYPVYEYVEKLSFDVKSMKDDSLLVSYEGIGERQSFTDMNRPSWISPCMYRCRW